MPISDIVSSDIGNCSYIRGVSRGLHQVIANMIIPKIRKDIVVIMRTRLPRIIIPFGIDRELDATWKCGTSIIQLPNIPIEVEFGKLGQARKIALNIAYIIKRISCCQRTLDVDSLQIGTDTAFKLLVKAHHLISIASVNKIVVNGQFLSFSFNTPNPSIMIRRSRVKNVGHTCLLISVVFIVCPYGTGASQP